MNSNNYAWIITAVFGVFAVAGWFLHLSSDEPDSTIEAVTTVLTTDNTPQLEQMNRSIDDLQAELKSLIAENTALVSLSDELKAQVESGRQTVAQHQTQVETISSQAMTAESESQKVITELSTKVSTLSEQIQKMETEFAELLEMTVSSDSPATGEIEAIKAERGKLLDKMNEMTKHIQMMEATAESTSTVDAAGEVTTQTSTSDSQSQTSAESSIAPDNTDGSATAQGDENRSDLQKSIDDAVELSDRVLNILADENQPSDQEREQLERDIENLTSTLNQSNAMVQVLTDETKVLAGENHILTNTLQIAQEQLARVSGALGNPHSRIDYLLNRLHNSRKQLKSLRTDNRQLAADIKRLNNDLTVMSNAIALQVSEKGQLATTLLEIAESQEAQINDILTRYTSIRLGSDVIFRSGSAKLNIQGRQTLQRIAAAFSADPNYVMSIEGHTDNQKISSSLAKLYPTNWELSAARAASAARFLTSQGVPENHVRVVGYGELQPIASNESEDGRRRNRRIEISLTPLLPQAQTN